MAAAGVSLGLPGRRRPAVGWVLAAALALCGGRWALAQPVAAAAAAPAAAEGSLHELEGLWVSDGPLAQPPQGDLTVARQGRQWQASLQGEQARFTGTSQGELRFAFAGNRGQFHGRLMMDGRIAGFWLQPSTTPANHQDGDPVAMRQPFATPLVLASVGSGQWRATVRALDARFTLYLAIQRTPEGRWVGVFRNPQINSNGGATQFRAARQGDTLVLTARPNEARPEIRHSATLLGAPQRLQLNWPDAGRVLMLERVSADKANGFFPRPPGRAYAYQAPPPAGDGWPTARAASVGMDEAALAQVVQKIADGDPAARRPMAIHSLLVARHGKLVLEEYFHGQDRDTVHDLRSAAKTYASVLLGAAMLHGQRVGPDTTVYPLMAPRGPFANPDPRKPQITLAHLLTHSSGLACDDNDDNSPGNEDRMQAQTAQPDWAKYTLDLPQAQAPGSRYAYCSASINLAGAALVQATGGWLPELFERWVARPLQFGPYYWNLMPNGQGYAGGGAYVRPRDLLKLGQVYLDGGVWAGRRIVSADWVKQSTAPHIRISPATTGLTPEQFGNGYIESEDGYAWHLQTLNTGTRTYRDYEATGNGGQQLIVVPELDLVVVFTGGNYNQGGIWNRWRQDIVARQIIPALR